MEDLNIHIITSSNSKSIEYDLVILDQAVSAADKFGDLGLVASEEIQNVAHTRARRQLVQLVNMAITEGSIKAAAGDKKGKKKRQDPEDAKLHDIPYVIDHADFQQNKDRAYPQTAHSIREDWMMEVMDRFFADPNPAPEPVFTSDNSHQTPWNPDEVAATANNPEYDQAAKWGRKGKKAKNDTWAGGEEFVKGDDKEEIGAHWDQQLEDMRAHQEATELGNDKQQNQMQEHYSAHLAAYREETEDNPAAEAVLDDLEDDNAAKSDDDGGDEDLANDDEEEGAAVGV